MAILGVSLNQWYGLNNRSQPPWAVALGTPVLIVAAIAHAGHSVVKDWREECRERKGERKGRTPSRGRRRSASATPSTMSAIPMSRAYVFPHSYRFFSIMLSHHRTTIVSQAPPGSRFVGFSLDNEPLFAFPPERGLSSVEASRRTSTIDPKLSAIATPQQSRSPDREVKFV